MNELLDRFCRYCRIDTQADERALTYPSSPGQLDLGRLLLQELQSMGLRDAVQDQFGLVHALIPATSKKAVPVIAWLAHQDTSPETSGKNVQPIVHANYQGQDIHLPGDTSKVIRVAENPELKELSGRTIITTDGTTLLGADNKAGVAVIMQAAKHLLTHPEIEHGPIRIIFTCDEEIGHGVDHIDLKSLNAVAAYTLDGAGAGEIEGETFSADKATVTIRGINIHPSIAKGKMVNAIRLASKFVDRMPQAELSPETTEGRQGFLHPYVMTGGVAETVIHILLRDFDTPKLSEKVELLRSIGRQIEMEHPGASVQIDVTKQYRNMADGMKLEPRAIPFAVEAMRRAGLKPRVGIVRGGTDGSRLTELGLPTPNLSTGEHNPHSPLEWTCLEEMESAVRVLVELAQVWAHPPA